MKKEFGAAIKTWRNRLGISQEELGARAGLHRTYISDIERGARNVSLESVEKLAGALNVSISSLFAVPGGKELLLSDGLVDILLVEDEADDLTLAMGALKNAKIANQIDVARDGAEALDYLFCKGRYARRKHPSRPLVVLLDLKLPKVDGLEVLRQIKADPRTFLTPVIVLTASRQDSDLIASKKLGAEAYIVKPVDFQNLSKATPKLSLKWALLKPEAGRPT